MRQGVPKRKICVLALGTSASLTVEFVGVNLNQDPGPDILVCDEAHMIKNRKADITQALRQVRTHRRIALTGSPLQNNLLEYYCVSVEDYSLQFLKYYWELLTILYLFWKQSQIPAAFLTSVVYSN